MFQEQYEHNLMELKKFVHTTNLILQCMMHQKRIAFLVKGYFIFASFFICKVQLTASKQENLHRVAHWRGHFKIGQMIRKDPEKHTCKYQTPKAELSTKIPKGYFPHSCK